jgi:hypothetical protein
MNDDPKYMTPLRNINSLPMVKLVLRRKQRRKILCARSSVALSIYASCAVGAVKEGAIACMKANGKKRVLDWKLIVQESVTHKEIKNQLGIKKQTKPSQRTVTIRYSVTLGKNKGNKVLHCQRQKRLLHSGFDLDLVRDLSEITRSGG